MKCPRLEKLLYVTNVLDIQSNSQRFLFVHIFFWTQPIGAFNHNHARNRHRLIQFACFIGTAVYFSYSGGKTNLKACAQRTWNFTKQCSLMEITVGQFTAFIFSTPEQRSQRAIVLPPGVSVTVGVGFHKCYSFALKFLGPHYFQTLRWIWFMFGMMKDIGPKFYTVSSPSPCTTLRSRSWT